MDHSVIRTKPGWGGEPKSGVQQHCQLQARTATDGPYSARICVSSLARCASWQALTGPEEFGDSESAQPLALPASQVS